jgi:hypothetical protein
VTVETVRVNPFAPSVTVRGLSRRARERAPFVTFDELYLNAAWSRSSASRRSWTR